jgi:hypothetical protein
VTHPDPSSDPDKKVWLNPLMRVIQRSDVDMRRLLRETADRAAADVERLALKPGIGASVRAGQLHAVRAALTGSLGDLWRAAGNLTKANRLKAIAEAMRVGADWDKRVFGIAMSDALRNQLKLGVTATADRNTRLMLQRYTHETIPLSEKVYHSEKLAGGWVDRAVNQALGRGLSARELAKEVRSLIKPDVPGGVSYAAMRLARTELNNAYHYAAIQDNQDKPFVDSFAWKLSKSHPRVDKCDEYAADSPYAKGEVPDKPHPQCFCYVAAQVIDEDDFVDNFKKGDYDDYLTDKYGLSDADFPDEPKKPVPKKITQRPAPKAKVDEKPSFGAAGGNTPLSKKPVAVVVAPGHTEPKSAPSVPAAEALLDSKGRLTRAGARAQAIRAVDTTKGTKEEQAKLIEIMTNSFTGVREQDARRVDVAQVGGLPAEHKTAAGLFVKENATGHGTMYVSPKSFDEGVSEWEKSGFFSDTGMPMIQRVIDHEFGHGIHFSQDPYGLGFSMFRAISNAMPGAVKPGGGLNDVEWIHKFVELNKDRIVNQVGTYAAKNDHEFIAELWATFRGKRPTALSKIVGDYLTRDPSQDD